MKRIRLPRDIRTGSPEELKRELERLWDSMSSGFASVSAGLELEPPQGTPIALQFGVIVPVSLTANGTCMFPVPELGEKRLFGFAKTAAFTLTAVQREGRLVNGASAYSRSAAGLVLGWSDGTNYWVTA